MARSITAPAAKGTVQGLGHHGYEAALRVLVEMARDQSGEH